MGDVIGWSKIGKLKKAFDDWKAPWTSTRASKLDNLDTSVSSVAKESTLNAKASQTSVDVMQSKINELETTLNDVWAIANFYKPAVFKDSTWSEIGEISNKGDAKKYFKIGDEKDITLTTGEVLTFQIYDFNHDDLESGGKAGITLGMKNLMSGNKPMNSSDTNIGGYSGSAMFKTMEQIYSQLPLEVQQVIKPVKKKTSAGNKLSSIKTDIVKTFLFSEIEVFGKVKHSFDGEGTQYPIFTTDQSRVKKLSNGSGSANYWWLRSPYYNDSGYFCYVSYDGTAYGDYASLNNGVCFGFCI